MRVLVDSFWQLNDRPTSLKHETVPKRYFQGGLVRVEGDALDAFRSRIGYEIFRGVKPEQDDDFKNPCGWEIGQALAQWARRWDQRIGYMHSRGIPLMAPSDEVARRLWFHEARAVVVDLAIRIAATLRRNNAPKAALDMFWALAARPTQPPIEIALTMLLGQKFTTREAADVLFGTGADKREMAKRRRSVRDWLNGAQPKAAKLYRIASMLAPKLELSRVAVGRVLFFAHGFRALHEAVIKVFGEPFARSCIQHLRAFTWRAWEFLDSARQDCLHDLLIEGAEADPTRQIFDADHDTTSVFPGKFVAGPHVAEAMAECKPPQEWLLAVQHAFLRRHFVLQAELPDAVGDYADERHAQLGESLHAGEWEAAIALAEEILAVFPGDYLAFEARGMALSAGGEPFVGTAYDDLQAGDRLGGNAFRALRLDRKSKAKSRSKKPPQA